MAASHASKRKSVDYVMKLLKYFLSNIYGDLVFCQLPEGITFQFTKIANSLTPPSQHCCFIGYGLYHKHNKEKRNQIFGGRKEIRGLRAESCEKPIPCDI